MDAGTLRVFFACLGHRSGSDGPGANVASGGNHRRWRELQANWVALQAALPQSIGPV